MDSLELYSAKTLGSKPKDTKKKKKTLSIKLGTKPLITPKRNIEAGKTVIVEKKRYKKGINTEPQSHTFSTNKQNTPEKILIENNEKSHRSLGWYRCPSLQCW